MAAVGYTKSNKNFIRSYRLLVDTGTPVLKELFETHVRIQGYSTIDDFLKNFSRRLQNPTLQKHQYDCLYPLGGRPVDIETWDISLLCLVLNKCCKLSPVEKHAVDTLRRTRNTMFSHKSTTSLDDTTFQSVWTDLETAILDILQHIGNQNLKNETQQRMKDIKENRIDGDEAVLDTIRHQLERLISVTESNNTETKLHDDKVILQRHLVKVYPEYSTMARLPVCPFESEEGIHVDKIYVEEKVRDITPMSRQSYIASENVYLDLANFGQLFKSPDADVPPRHVVLTGSAGRGKTTFCLRMISVWCSAVQKILESKTDLTDLEDDLITQYELLYFISLRNAIDEESVIDMIASQILQENKALIENVKSCFQGMPDKCLIIIDGLDEWLSSSNLPRRGDLNFCKILWTTRHSKLHILTGLPNTRILEIAKLEEKNIRLLVHNVLTQYYRLLNKSVGSQVEKFMTDLNKHSMQLIAEVPMVLIYLVCLWREQHGLEDSRTVNFIGILDYLLRKTETTTGKSKPVNLPGALNVHDHVKKNAQLLRRLCPFAYDCCLQSLYVFEERPVEGLIGQETMNNCLITGLLSKTHIHTSTSRGRIQFFHKTLQELLAAVWVCWEEQKNHAALEAIWSACNTTEKIMEMSLILIFACGLNPKKAEKISKHVAKTALYEDAFIQYRQTLEGRYSFRRSRDASFSYRRIKRIQHLMLECKREMLLNRRYFGETNNKISTSFGSVFSVRCIDTVFPLYDVVIVDKLAEDVIEILKENKTHLRSIYVDLPKSERSEQIEDVICKTSQLERLHLDHTSSSVIFRLASSQMERLRSLCLCLSNIRELPNSIAYLRNICALCLSISGDHRTVEQLESFLKTSKTLKELELESVICEDHKRETRKCKYLIDVSGSNNLKRLKLENVSSVCTILPYSVQLEGVWISGAASNPSSCLCRLSESSSLSSLVLGHLQPFRHWIRADYEKVASVLPRLHHLEYVYLVGINFERFGVIPTFSCQRKLKYLSLESIQLSKSGWITLLLSLVTHKGEEIVCKAEVQIMSTNPQKYADVWSKVKGVSIQANETRIVLGMKQETCRERLLALNAIKFSTTV
ncbi:uncharacterized protein LOC128559540 [Mercenaria mercenaria]|uniref:uncharacterized protein LOC128559540 n=1 Tax=Mercenaria mercenaria TaxID=6596 RepID=UPI00234F5B8B|nr:uncharacterized protein LOC128559540 [Mercenaria mercenaria]